MLSNKAMPQGTSASFPAVILSHTAQLDTARVLGREKLVFPVHLLHPHPSSVELPRPDHKLLFCFLFHRDLLESRDSMDPLAQR